MPHSDCLDHPEFGRSIGIAEDAHRGIRQRWIRQCGRPKDVAHEAIAQSEQRLPAMTQAQSPMVLASYSAQGEETPIAQAVSEQDVWYERRLPSYLRQHAQQTSVNKTEHGLPYARAASLEGQ